ncbi:MAG TPA: hypothetical protein VJP79_05830 [Nitrososphaera sp.]|nr:hypothetical protein [Nitrososphaera sp.]
MKKTSNASSDGDLASFEGEYPKDLFNKSVVLGGQTVGHVVRETDDQIVVFSDSGDARFDIPKSAIAVAGGSVVINEESIDQYSRDKDAPLPMGRSLRPSAEEIRNSARQHQLEEERKKAITTATTSTTPDAIMSEATSLTTSPRSETVGVSTPEGYVDTESELSKKMKRAASELKQIIVAGTKVAKNEAKKAKRKAEAKQAAMDREAISRMGALAGTFSESFEDILTATRTRKYGDQVEIYTGFLKLLDQQRELIVARRDMAIRLRDSVDVPVVEPKDMDRRQLKSPPKLPAPEDLDVSSSSYRARTGSTRQTVRRSRTETA